MFLSRLLTKDSAARLKAKATFTKVKSHSEAVSLSLEKDPSKAFSDQWPFTASKGTVLGFSGGCHFETTLETIRFVVGEDLLPVELGARVKLSKFSFIYQLFRNALPLANEAFKACIAEMPDCVHWFSRDNWARLQLLRAGPPILDYVCSHRSQIVLLDVGYIFDNVDLPWRGEKRGLFLVILAVAWSGRLD